MHLAELPKPDVFNSMLPGLGRDWTEITPSLSVVYYRTASYATEWEAVAARWAADDHTLLQPAEPCWLLPLLHVGNMLKQTVAKKELELCDSPCLANTKGRRVVVRHGGCARANGRVAATRRLGVTSGTGAVLGALLASVTKEPAAEDKQT
jgi:hypothetical protein